MWAHVFLRPHTRQRAGCALLRHQRLHEVHSSAVNQGIDLDALTSGVRDGPLLAYRNAVKQNEIYVDQAQLKAVVPLQVAVLRAYYT